MPCEFRFKTRSGHALEWASIDGRAAGANHGATSCARRVGTLLSALNTMIANRTCFPEVKPTREKLSTKQGRQVRRDDTSAIRSAVGARCVHQAALGRFKAIDIDQQMQAAASIRQTSVQAPRSSSGLTLMLPGERRISAGKYQRLS